MNGSRLKQKGEVKDFRPFMKLRAYKILPRAVTMQPAIISSIFFVFTKRLNIYRLPVDLLLR